jgi:8-oxo-dGTP pyrophosphatase MutT (NUDIX family)
MAQSSRPRDAATLILVDSSGGQPRVLMGRRAGGHVFMPDKWVFPGGRLDRGDWFAPVEADLPPDVSAAVAMAPRRVPGDPRRLARALALAAVRETFEETGLVLGRPGTPLRGPPAWAPFLGQGYRPDLSSLTYVARAITPPGRTRRFDARFFLSDAAHLADPTPKDSRELEELRWFPLAETAALDLPTVTRMVLGLVERTVAGERVTPPFWAWHRKSED